MSDPVGTALERFAPVALEALGDARLLDRIDTKFLLDEADLVRFLVACQASYDLLTIAGMRDFPYQTVYLDDRDWHLFRAHLAIRPQRCKVRVRRYEPSGERWLEVKERQRSGRTVKVRLPFDLPDGGIAAALAHPIIEGITLGVAPEALRPVMDIRYRRITLVAKDRRERVTIDRDLTWVRDARMAAVRGKVLIELKQQARRSSPAWRAALALGSIEEAVSKYCLGVVALVEGAPPGRYRQLLRRLGVVPPPSSHPLARSA